MKLLLWIALIVVAVVLFGTVPLYAIGFVLNLLASGLIWLAKLLDVFGFTRSARFSLISEVLTGNLTIGGEI